MLYQEYFTSYEWNEKRNSVIARCNGICEKCHTNKVIHIHHLTYIDFGNESLDQLMGLCEKCHQSYHPNKTIKRKFLLINALCKQLNIKISALKSILYKAKWMEKQLISYDPCENTKTTYDGPTDLAFNLGVVKRQPRKKPRGRRGPWMWSLTDVEKLL